MGHNEWIAAESSWPYVWWAVFLGCAVLAQIVRPIDLPGDVVAVVIVMLAYGCACFTFLACRPPALVFRPDGVTIRRMRESITVSWEAIAADHFALRRVGLLGLSEPEPPSRSARLLRLSRLDVPAQRVADLIAFYRDHPDRRHEVGQPRPLVPVSVEG
jgi:hypothetical protein